MIADHMEAAIRKLRSLTISAATVALAALFALVAFAMFTGAAFVWLSERYDAVTAFLAIGGGFVAVSAVCVLTMYVLSQRERRRPAPLETRPQTQPSAWLEPAFIAAGIDIVRVVGGRRAASLAAGALALYWLVSRDGPAPRKRSQRLVPPVD